MMMTAGSEVFYMELVNKVITSSKEAQRIVAEPLCNRKKPFKTVLDKGTKETTLFYSESQLNFIQKKYAEIMNNPNIDIIAEYNPDRIDMCIMCAIESVLVSLEDKTYSKKLFREIPISTVDIIRQIKMKDDYNPPTEEIDKMSKRIAKLCSVFMKISVHDSRRRKNPIVFSESGYLLNMVHQRVSTTDDNNKEKILEDKWLIQGYPFLFRYASLPSLNRVRTLDKSYFPALKGVNKSENVIILNDVLAFRIDEMIKGHLNNRHIAYEYEKNGVPKGLLAECGIFRQNYEDATTWRMTKSRIHKLVCKYLEVYKTDGKIKNFTIDYEKKSIVGVCIELE